MKRYYSLFAVGLLGAGIAFAMNSSRANDDSQTAPAEQKDEIAKVIDLVDRIQQLEKRLAKLEVHEPLIRQADSREDTNNDIHLARPKPSTPSQDEMSVDDEPQKTNGQAWKFRLLTFRPNSSSSQDSTPRPSSSESQETDSKPDQEMPRHVAKNET